MSDDRLIRELKALDRPVEPDLAFESALFARLEAEYAKQSRPSRPLLVLLAAALLVALAVGATLAVGSGLIEAPWLAQEDFPTGSPAASAAGSLTPIGPAANGLIAYPVESDDGENLDIYTRDLTTGAERVLVSGPEDDDRPAFSPDGSLVTFVRRSIEGDAVMAANGDGTDVRAIFGPAPGSVAHIAWSPDGRQLALLVDQAGAPSLWVVAIDGNERREIRLARQATWLWGWRRVDGGELIVSVGGQVHGVRPDGTGFRQISAFPYRGGMGPGEISPDGTLLAYTYSDTIHLLDLDTGADRTWGLALPQPVDGEEPYADTHARFSPDGTKLAFTRHWGQQAGGIYPGADHQVWVASVASDGADGVAVGPVLHADGTADFYLGSLYAPDGSQILISFSISVGQTSTGQAKSDERAWLADPAGGDAISLEVPVIAGWDWQRLP